MPSTAPGPASTLVLPELELLDEVVVLLPELLEDVVVLLPELELVDDELLLDDELVDDVGTPELVLIEDVEALEPEEAETVAVVDDDVPDVADVLDAVALEVEALEVEALDAVALDDELVLLELPVLRLPLDAVLAPADDTAVEAGPPLEDDELELFPLLKQPGAASSSAQMSARLPLSMFPSGREARRYHGRATPPGLRRGAAFYWPTTMEQSVIAAPGQPASTSDAEL